MILAAVLVTTLLNPAWCVHYIVSAAPNSNYNNNDNNSKRAYLLSVSTLSKVTILVAQLMDYKFQFGSHYGRERERERQTDKLSVAARHNKPLSFGAV